MRRREVLQLGAFWVACRARTEPAVVEPEPAPTRLDDRVLDELYEQLHANEHAAEHGLSTHAPMVVEAICTLGAADRAKAWLAGYRGTRAEVPKPHAAIDPARWREALGPDRRATTWEAAVHRWADWRELFIAELAAAPWREVLDRWVARLASGLSAAATHGVIRTSHAVRALSRSETAPRRAELARGLAYWAAAYEELPARAGTAVADPLAKVPRRTTAPRGNIVEGLRAAGQLAHFDTVRDLIATPPDLGAGISTLAATFSRVYLQHAEAHPIAFVHAVTGPCALRRLAPHVSAETASSAFPYAWQTAAAIYAAYATTDRAAPRIEPALSREELAGRALDHGNDHAIKFAEVLLAEHALTGDAAFLAAGEDALARL